MTVELYTKTTGPTCQPCRLTKQALEKNNIQYAEFPIEDHAGAMQALGYQQAPVVVAGPTTHWSGFRPEQISGLVA